MKNVTVGPEHIAAGKRDNARFCPVVLALSAASIAGVGLYGAAVGPPLVGAVSDALRGGPGSPPRRSPEHDEHEGLVRLGDGHYLNPGPRFEAPTAEEKARRDRQERARRRYLDREERP